MITLLTGENSYRIRQSLNRLLDEAAGAHGPEAIVRVDGSSLSADELPQLLTGANLFSSEQVVVMHEPSRTKAVWDRLGDLAEHVDDSTSLIIVEGKPDKRTKTYKALQAHGDIRSHGLLDESGLVSWLQAHAREQGMNLEPETARYLIQYVGSDQWRLHHDVDKLAALGKPVTNELIRDILEPEPRASAFEVLDVALAGNQRAAEAQLDILSAYEEPYRFFGLLASQVYAVAVCKAAGSRSPDQVAKDAGIHPYVAKKTLSLVRRYDPGDVRHLVSLVAECDERMKSSGTDPWVLMKLTIGAIAARAN